MSQDQSMSAYGTAMQEANMSQPPQYHQIISQPWFKDLDNRLSDKMRGFQETIKKQNDEILLLKQQVESTQIFHKRALDDLNHYKESQRVIDNLNSQLNQNMKNFRNMEIDKNTHIEYMQGQIKHLNDQINKLLLKEAEQEKWKRVANNIGQKERDFQKAILDKDIEIEKLKQQLIKGDDNRYDEYVTRIRTMDKQIDNLMNTITKKDEELFNCQKRIDLVLNSSNNDVVRREQILIQNQKQDMEKMVKEQISVYQKELKNKDDIIQKLNQDRKIQEERITMTENHRQTISNINNDINDAIVWQRKYNQLQAESKEILSLKQNLQEEITNIRRNDQQKYESMMDELKGQINSQNQQIQQLKSELSNHTYEIQSRETKIQQLSSETQTLKVNEQNYRNREKEIEGLRATISVLKKENEYLYPNIASKGYTNQHIAENTNYDMQQPYSLKNIQPVNTNQQYRSTEQPNQYQVQFNNSSMQYGRNTYQY